MKLLGLNQWPVELIIRSFSSFGGVSRDLVGQGDAFCPIYRTELNWKINITLAILLLVSVHVLCYFRNYFWINCHWYFYCCDLFSKDDQLVWFRSWNILVLVCLNVSLYLYLYIKDPYRLSNVKFITADAVDLISSWVIVIYLVICCFLTFIDDYSKLIILCLRS